MAVTSNPVKKKEEQQYTGLAGVSKNTAQRMGQANQGYQPSQQAQQAQQQLQQVQSQRPQGFKSKYGADLDNILQQIQNPQEVKYEFNGDNLFRSYADYYTQMGKQASLDAMGQAAALTGGYGNSYGQMVGQQQYQQYLLPLYDRGMELQQQAYQRQRDKIGDQYRQYELLADAEGQEYDRYRDTMGDWEREREYQAGRADTEQNRSWDQFLQDRDYWAKLAQVENADYRSEQERQEAIRQFNENFAEDRRRYNQDFAENVRRNDRDYNRGVLESDRNYAEDVRRNDRDYNRGVLESDREFNENRRLADQDERYRQQEFGWKQYTDRRDFDENRRLSDQDEAYRQRTLAEQIRQNDLDERYRQQTLAEQIRQNDLDERYRQQSFAESVRQFNENMNWDRMTSDQKYAAQYAMSILENGQMPSLEMLKAAGLSEEDARKLMAQLEQAGGGSGSGGGGGNGGGNGGTNVPPGYISAQDAQRYAEMLQQSTLAGQERIGKVKPIRAEESQDKNKKKKMLR